MQMTFKQLSLPSRLLRAPHIHVQLFFSLFPFESSAVILNSTSSKYDSSLSTNKMQSVFFSFALVPNIGPGARHIVGLYTSSVWKHLDVCLLSLSLSTSLSLSHRHTHTERQLHNLWGLVQNKNEGPFVGKAGRKVLLKVLK